MSTKRRFVLVSVMTAVMVMMVTLIVTFINLGLRPDFISQWARAYIIAWPIAAITGFLIMPAAQRLTARLMLLLGEDA